MKDAHSRLTELVDIHLGTRSTMSLEGLVGVLERELPELIAKLRTDAICEAAEQCESEQRACEKLARAFPKSPIHATGVTIANVCARRVRGLLGQKSTQSESEAAK